VKSRPTFPKPDEEMARRATLLADEMRRWPDVRLGKMFGMTCVYRGGTIFALLPATRALERANAIAIRRNDVAGAPRRSGSASILTATSTWATP
jgi:hypothetical protein